MPRRFLEKCGQPDSSGLDSLDTSGGSGDTENQQLEPSSDDSSHGNSSLDKSNIDMESMNDQSMDCEVKVRKLVIKTDGMNFSSAFKRGSIEQSDASIDPDRDLSDGEGSQSPGEHSQTTHDMVGASYGSSSALEEEDENTNDYSGLEEETRQAAILISSADESEDTQQEYSIQEQTKAIRHSHSHSYELTKDLLHSNENSKDDLMESIETYHRQLSGIGYIPEHSPLSAPPDSEADDEVEMLDKYQPVTECLTDSEENSYFQGDSRSYQPPRSQLTEHDVQQGTMGLTHNANSYRGQDSDPESDQEVKAQMQSAINSILSLNPSAADDDSLYQYNQPRQFFQGSNQANDMLGDTDQDDTDNDNVNGNFFLLDSGNSTSNSMSTDLDDAVNSILS